MHHKFTETKTPYPLHSPSSASHLVIQRLCAPQLSIRRNFVLFVHLSSNMAGDNPDGVKTLEAKCLCGSVHFTIDVPKPSLPLRVHLCYCSLCRFSLGTPCIFHAPLSKDIVPKFVEPSSADNMTAYLPKGCGATLNFCSTCGCHITAIDLQEGYWVVASSIFLDHGPDNFVIRTHGFSKSVKDGGISKMLTHIDGREVGHYNPPDDDPSAKLVESTPEIGADGKDRMRAECHCGGVSFTFPRPTEEVINDEYMSQFVSHKDKTKWHACLDACDDCRLVNGTHILGWTFIPLEIIEPHIGPDLLIGTAKTYQSSPEVLRSFCGTCGATFFFSHSDRRPSDRQHIVDLALGVLRAPEGFMAENWLTWRARLAWLDSGKRYDKGFSEALQEGMNKYVLENEGKIEDYNIG
ncbi:Mss4-like protein [Mariannaea sp. PMI_226]|nr:Mss4-like protein [Mariannaea sp. PMI_226]